MPNKSSSAGIASETVNRNSDPAAWQTGLFDSGNYSDLLVSCEDQKWKVHRVIVCAWCPFFRKACEGFQEGESGSVNLPDGDRTEDVERMLRWIYSKDYSDQVGNQPLLINARMYALADKYAIIALKHHAKQKFQDSPQYPKSGLDGNYPQFDSKAFEPLMDTIPVVYTSTPNSDRGLRDLVMEVFRPYKKGLESDKTFMGLFKSGLAEAEFAVDVLKAWTTTHRTDLDAFEWLCTSCKPQHTIGGNLHVECYYCGSSLGGFKESSPEWQRQRKSVETNSD